MKLHVGVQHAMHGVHARSSCADSAELYSMYTQNHSGLQQSTPSLLNPIHGRSQIVVSMLAKIVI